MANGNDKKSLWRPVSDADFQVGGGGGDVTRDPNDPLRTGAGMAERAVGQARGTLRENITRPGPASIDPYERKSAQEGYAAAQGIYPGYSGDRPTSIGQATAREAAKTLPLYIPGPGKGQLLSQITKGAAMGAGGGALEHGLVQAGRGQLPTAGGTLRAAGTGAAFGGVMGPLSEVPAVRRLVSKLPYLRRMMPEAAAAPESAAGLSTAVEAAPQAAASAPTMSAEPSRIVTLEQAAREGGMASAAGGAPAWETQAYTPEAQRLLEKIQRGEYTGGVDPVQKSLRRQFEKIPPRPRTR